MSKDEAPEFAGVRVRGCFFYQHGCASRKDAVGTGYLLNRTPQNPYDSSAVEVHTDAGEMTGHIERGVAAQLAPWMDKGWLYTCVKTGNFACDNIVHLVPIKSAKEETKAVNTEPFDVNKLLELEDA